VGYPEDMRGQIKLPEFVKNRQPQPGDLEAVRAWAAAKGLCKADAPVNNLVEIVR
jgi:NitT/TauT family transport system substrate-binding protein